ncbi:glycosyltransferase [Methylomonas sp. CM2]|uniref:glycosyltransferase n=1 Tax=Methylomonas sp. CM2 TaxID=3417647 RepID=UPI003CF02C38
MTHEVPLIATGDRHFPPLPASAQAAILLPTARWTPMARSVIASLVGTANEETVVLVADNSETPEKREFLERIRALNPYIFAIAHQKNVGGAGNLSYLFEWCGDLPYCAMMADDDWMSPTYHTDAFELLRGDAKLSCAEVGSTFVDIGDGKLVNVSQAAMQGATPAERLPTWRPEVARATMYNASRRGALNHALQFLAATPLHGLTLAEDLWELNRLALGDFVSQPGPGCLVHYPANGSQNGDGTQRFYELICKGVGLQFSFVYFTALSTAVQCALFLGGSRSPIADPLQRAVCAQQAFAKIYTAGFLPMVSAESSHAAARMLFAEHPRALAGYLKFCAPPYSLQPVFAADLVCWFIELIEVFEDKTPPAPERLSRRFAHFVDGLMPGLLNADGDC